MKLELWLLAFSSFHKEQQKAQRKLEPHMRVNDGTVTRVLLEHWKVLKSLWLKNRPSYSALWVNEKTMDCYSWSLDVSSECICFSTCLCFSVVVWVRKRSRVPTIFSRVPHRYMARMSAWRADHMIAPNANELSISSMSILKYTTQYTVSSIPFRVCTVVHYEHQVHIEHSTSADRDNETMCPMFHQCAVSIPQTHQRWKHGGFCKLTWKVHRSKSSLVCLIWWSNCPKSVQWTLLMYL